MTSEVVDRFARGGMSGADLAALANTFDLHDLQTSLPIWKYWSYLDALLDMSSGSCLLDDLILGDVVVEDIEFKSYEVFVRNFPRAALAVLIEQRPVLEEQHRALRDEAQRQSADMRQRRAAARAAWQAERKR